MFLKNLGVLCEVGFYIICKSGGRMCVIIAYNFYKYKNSETAKNLNLAVIKIFNFIETES